MKREFNYDKLRGKIYEKYRSISNFALEVGKDKSSIVQKLNNKARLTLDDVILYCDFLDIKKEDIAYYFFDEKR